MKEDVLFKIQWEVCFFITLLSESQYKYYIVPHFLFIFNTNDLVSLIYWIN